MPWFRGQAESDESDDTSTENGQEMEERAEHANGQQNAGSESGTESDGMAESDGEPDTEPADVDEESAERSRIEAQIDARINRATKAEQARARANYARRVWLDARPIPYRMEHPEQIIPKEPTTTGRVPRVVGSGPRTITGRVGSPTRADVYGHKSPRALKAARTPKPAPVPKAAKRGPATDPMRFFGVQQGTAAAQASGGKASADPMKQCFCPQPTADAESFFCGHGGADGRQATKQDKRSEMAGFVLGKQTGDNLATVLFGGKDGKHGNGAKKGKGKDKKGKDKMAEFFRV